jgi:lambda repressor-like predicted transcriptional regulator
MAKQKIVIDVRETIYNKLKTEGRTLAWLSKQTGINYNALYSCLCRKMFEITPDYLKLINEALKTGYTL